MTINIFTGPFEKIQTKALILFVHEGKKISFTKEVIDQIPTVARKSFTGKFGETLIVFPSNPAIERIVLVGLGDGKTDRDLLEVFRRSLGTTVKRLVKEDVREIGVYLGGVLDSSKDQEIRTYIKEAIVVSLIAPYTFEKHLSKKQRDHELDSFTLIAPLARKKDDLHRIMQKALILADAVRVARDLVNSPSNIMTPVALAKAAGKLADAHETLTCSVLGKKRLIEQAFGGILAVSQGSHAEPQLITFEYKPKKATKTIVLVGKGVTFDTGGINLKPERGMSEMHMDMAGGAAVLATVYAVAALELPIHVVAIVPAAENMPSGTAIKPGDIITSKSGLTIEVANTDAEGRIILADALTYAATFKPDLMIDCATLTGAALVALGEERAAILGNNQLLINDLLDSGDDTAELLWQLPLDDDYREHVKSEIADVKNLGKGGAGVIAGAAFLEKFVPKGMPWAHIDLAGPAMRSEPGAYAPKRGTGWGVRLLVDFIGRQAAA